MHKEADSKPKEADYLPDGIEKRVLEAAAEEERLRQERKDKKKEEKRRKEAEQEGLEGEADEDMMALMGFGGFGTSKPT
jgi:U4/U6.U5 tri-snRNP component SNU23